MVCSINLSGVTPDSYYKRVYLQLKSGLGHLFTWSTLEGCGCRRGSHLYFLPLTAFRETEVMVSYYNWFAVAQ